MTGQDGAPVRVTAWGELRAERSLPGALRVMVDGQAAGGAERVGDAWRASWYTVAVKGRCTEHATAQDAVKAVIRSGWARRLGARAGSPVSWSDMATRRAAGPARAGAR